MTEESDSQSLSRKILELAAAQGMLPTATYNSLSSLDGDVCDHAIEREVLSTADVDLLRPLVEPTTYLPGYEIEELVGQGAAGAVYRAKHITLGRDVALKLLRSGLLDDASVTARSQLEARIGASLQHPGIVSVYDYGVHQQRVYLAMEFLSGESLEEVIDRRGPIDPMQSLRMVRQVSTALRYANSEGVVHRDIKPANLMLTEDKVGLSDLPDKKVIKVTDFGLAFNMQRTDLTRLTVAGATLGSPSYVAPEQLESTDVDKRADIYALGATLFHLVTGKQPFGTANVFKAIAAKMQGSEEWLEELDESVPNSVRRLIRDMSRSNPEERIPDYETLEARIQQILEGTASETPLQEPGSTGSSRKWLPAIAVVGLIAAAALTLGLLPNSNHPTPDNPQFKQPFREEVTRSDSEVLLFDGFKLPDNRMRSIWRVGRNAETTRVLEGSDGWMRFVVDPQQTSSGYFDFRIEVDTSLDAEVDVCFGFEPNGECQIVRIKEGLAIAGMGVIQDNRSGFGEGIQDAANVFDATGPPAKLRLTGTLNAVRIHRQPDAWFVNVNGKPLTATQAKQADGSAIYVRTNGRAYFSDIAIVPLQPATPKN